MERKHPDDSYFELQYLPEGVKITVYPPIAKGKRLESSDVIEIIRKKKIANYDAKVIEHAVQQADKRPYRFAPPQEPAKIDATMTFLASPDKMQGFLKIVPPDGGRNMTAQEIHDFLKKENISVGIKEEVLQSLEKEPVFFKEILVAEGIYVVHGSAGKVIYHFDTSNESKPTILDDGRVDYKELNLVKSVTNGQVLCSLEPPVQGTDGKTIFGQAVPFTPGKPAVFPKGRNVQTVNNGAELISSIDGMVEILDGKVNVFSTYEIPADVDNSTGNIVFSGNVLVRGNILSGFSIEAKGNIEVWGSVEGAHLEADGDIILKRGIQGMNKGFLKSKNDIIARYIESCTHVEAKRFIKAEAIMHSNVKCGNMVELSGKKGLLVGGVCKVGNLLRAKVIGSHMNTVTEIEVGIDPVMKERYKFLKDELVTTEADLKKMEQAISLLKKASEVTALPPDKQELLNKSIKTKFTLMEKMNHMKIEFQEIDEKLQQVAEGKVKIQNVAYSGVRVSIGTCIMYVKKDLEKCTLYRDGADVRVGPY